MSRFQTRTRYVEAIQHENMHETTAWLNSIEDAEEIEYTVAAGTLLIVTGGKRRAILPGDWIVLDGNTLRLYAANSFDDAYLPADPLCFDAPTTAEIEEAVGEANKHVSDAIRESSFLAGMLMETAERLDRLADKRPSRRVNTLLGNEWKQAQTMADNAPGSYKQGYSDAIVAVAKQLGVRPEALQ